MNKIDWSKKLTSRKFWMALAGLVVGVLALFAVDANTTTQISGVIMALGSVIAYIVGEGLVDASAVSTPGVPDSAPVAGVVDGVQQADIAAPNPPAGSAPDDTANVAASLPDNQTAPTAENIAKAVALMEALQKIYPQSSTGNQ